jgi:hypothetical protein
VLETPAELLDWGVKRRRHKDGPRGGAWVRNGLPSLLAMWQPSLVVIKEPSKHKTARMQRLLAGITREAGQRRIPVRCLPERAIRRAVGNESHVTKYAMASILCRHFPFLASALPSPRRAWESEDYRMNMFAAVALALAASGQRHTINR